MGLVAWLLVRWGDDGDLLAGEAGVGEDVGDGHQEHSVDEWTGVARVDQGCHGLDRQPWGVEEVIFARVLLEDEEENGRHGGRVLSGG